MARSEFVCRACGKRSRFVRQSLRLMLEMKRATLPEDEKQSRTYECEHCLAENVVTQPRKAWVHIDLEAS